MKSKTWLLFLIIILASFLASRYLFRPGYFPMHDDMQAMRVLQMDKCFRDGQIPCRWVPDMGYGYGYPQFLYYSPLPYYLMEGFHLLGFSILASVKIGFILSFVFSGLAMFLLGQSLWGDLGGLVSAVFYIYAPYRAADVYTRGAVGEFWGLVFLPLIFWAILEFVKSEKLRFLTFFSLSLAGLLTTHNITSLIFIPILGFWIIFLLWHYQKKNLFIKIILGLFWSFSLAGFFILPLIFEKKFAHTETMFMGYFNFLAHFVSWRQLFTVTHWGFGSSELGPNDDLSFYIGILHWLVSLLTMIIVFLRRKIAKNSSLAIFFFLVFLATAFMTHQRSVFIWNKISLLTYLQFPWRFLVLVVFSTSVLAGYIISLTGKLSYKIYLTFLLVVGVIFLNAYYFRPREWYEITDQEKFSGENWEKQLTISIFDYLPIFAQMPPAQKAPDFPLIISGQAEVLDYQKGTDWQKGKLLVSSKTAEVRLPLYYFPGFKVWVNGKSQGINHDNELGLITFPLSGGEQEILVKLTKTWPRLIGDYLTAGGILLLLLIVVNEKKLLGFKIKK